MILILFDSVEQQTILMQVMNTNEKFICYWHNCRRRPDTNQRRTTWHWRDTSWPMCIVRKRC